MANPETAIWQRQKGKTAREAAGQSMVEFALILPLLFVMLFGIVELGILLNIYIGMSNTAREAARAGAIYQYTGSAPTNGDTTVVAAIDQQRRQYIDDVIEATVNPIIDPATELNVTVSYTPTTALATNVYRSGNTIAVLLEHEHDLFFGLLGPQTIMIRAQSAMRIEPGGVVD